jgi:hypothetical protein
MSNSGAKRLKKDLTWRWYRHSFPELSIGQPLNLIQLIVFLFPNTRYTFSNWWTHHQPTNTMFWNHLFLLRNREGQLSQITYSQFIGNNTCCVTLSINHEFYLSNAENSVNTLKNISLWIPKFRNLEKIAQWEAAWFWLHEKYY